MSPTKEGLQAHEVSIDRGATAFGAVVVDNLTDKGEDIYHVRYTGNKENTGVNNDDGVSNPTGVTNDNGDAANLTGVTDDRREDSAIDTIADSKKL